MYIHVIILLMHTCGYYKLNNKIILKSVSYGVGMKIPKVSLSFLINLAKNLYSSHNESYYIHCSLQSFFSSLKCLRYEI